MTNIIFAMLRFRLFLRMGGNSDIEIQCNSYINLRIETYVQNYMQ